MARRSPLTDALGQRFGMLSAAVMTIAAPGALADTARDPSELARAAQNPISSVISLPIQNNLNFHVGPYRNPQNVLNVQPVVPVPISDSWNLITRIIVPVVSQPQLTPNGERTFGIGDINPTLFFSPKAPTGGVIWGVGPTFVFPTGTDGTLTSGKYSAGPAAVALTIQGPWVVGALVNNVWSFAGDRTRKDVNLLTMQPFVNYNFPGGWYLTSSPVITANWKASGSDRWTVPVGGGFGRVFKLGDQPVNAQLAAYYNVARPTGAADWQIRAQLQFLFPQ